MRTALLVALALAACKPKEKHGATRVLAEDAATVPAARVARPGEPTVGLRVAAGTVRDAESWDGYAVIVPAGGDPAAAKAAIDAVVTARKLAATVEVSTVAETGFEPGRLRYFGRDVPDADVARLAQAKDAVIVMASGPSSDAAEVLHATAAATRSGAAAVTGWIQDLVTSETFTLASFDAARPVEFPLDARTTVVFHAVRDDDSTTFFESFGLVRYGLPELYMTGVPQSFSSDAHELVNAAAQTLIERGAIDGDGVLTIDAAALRTGTWPDFTKALADTGGTGKATLTATWSIGDNAGEPDAPVEIELAIPGGTSPERLLETLAGFLGKRADPVESTSAGDAELDAARKRAQDDLITLAPHFAQGVPELERLIVKAPFTTDDGGTEWMWVEVDAWKGQTMTGILINEPFAVSALKIGARVEVRQSDLFDYVHHLADGSDHGGETSRILERRQ